MLTHTSGEPGPVTEAGVATVEIRGITVTFPGVRVLDAVSMRLLPGEVHALLGENGAGKSTLIKALTGVHRPLAGEILMRGEPVTVRNPAHAQAIGISTVHQEINLATNLSVAENVMLGRERRRFGAIDRKDMRRRTAEVLAQLHLDIDPGSPLAYHSLAVQQLVSIARAVQVDAQVLVLDEPTSSLDTHEVDELFEVIDRIKASGVAVLFVSHFLDQVYRISDRITVLRNGRLVGEHLTAELPRLQLVSEMLGRSLDILDELDVATQSNTDTSEAPTFLAAKGLSRRASIEPADLELHNGEIVGLAGLLGSGRTELARLLYGADRADHGEIVVEGHEIRLRNPRVALRSHIAFSSENRRAEGLIGDLSVRANIVLAMQSERGWARAIPRRQQAEIADRYVKALDIRPTDPEALVRNLSGGNQQKVLLARWLLTAPRLLILDEPTRGIDVGAKAEIQRLITSLADDGMSVLFISAELEEVVRLSHRIVVMRDRRKVAEIANRDTSVDDLIAIIAEVATPEADEGAGRGGVGVKSVLSHRLLWPILILVVLLVITRLQAPNFFDIRVVRGNLFGSLVNIARNTAPTMLVGLGMTLVIATRGVDLSVGAVAAIAGAAATMFLQDTGDPSRVVNVLLAVGIALGLAVLCGAWNGFLVTVVGIQPIVATLVLMTAGRGLAQLITDEQIITIHSEPYEMIGGGYWLGLPFSIILASVIFLLASLLVRRTALGVLLESVGVNPEASRLAGVPSRSITWTVYIACALLAGLAGLMITSNATAADPNSTGLFLEIDAILAVVIGGTSLAGGRFSLAGTLLGAFIIQTMTTMILTLGIAPQITLVYKAAIVALVCIIQSSEARALISRLVFRRRLEQSTLPASSESADLEESVTVPIVDASDLVSVATDVTGEP